MGANNFAITIFYKNNNKIAKTIIDRIYDEFAFCENKILSQNIGCTIRLFGDITIFNEDFIKEELYIFIITDDMGRDVKKYIEIYDKIYDRALNTLIISFVSNKDYFNAKNHTINTYMLNEKFLKQELSKIMCIVAQKLTKTSITLFLSYYRQEGTKICESFKKALFSLPGIHEFMDVKEIEYGTEIQKKIENSISESILICFSTNEYSERFWGTKELLLAKEKNLPIVVVDCLKNVEQRRNPNSGNVPVIRYKTTNFSQFVAETVLLAIKEKLKKLKIRDKYKKTDNCKLLWKSPELYDIKQAEKENITTLIYPSPPICQCENDYYSSISDVKLVLDNNLQKKNEKELKICISFSNTEPTPILHRSFFNNLINEIIRYCVYSNYQILYGGDWRENGLTQKILEYYSIYRSRNNNPVKFLINYYANLNNENINSYYSRIANLGDIIEFKYSDVYETNASANKDVKAKLLSTMRTDMINNADALIVLGGKMESCFGYTSGIAEEVGIALSMKKPVFLIGCLCGAAKQTIDMLKGHKKEFFPSFNSEKACVKTKNINDIIKNFNINKLSKNNKLTIKQNEILFNSINIEEIVQIIFKALSKI